MYNFFTSGSYLPQSMCYPRDIVVPALILTCKPSQETVHFNQPLWSILQETDFFPAWPHSLDWHYFTDYCMQECHKPKAFCIQEFTNMIYLGILLRLFSLALKHNFSICCSS